MLASSESSERAAPLSVLAAGRGHLSMPSPHQPDVEGHAVNRKGFRTASSQPGHFDGGSQHDGASKAALEGLSDGWDAESSSGSWGIEVRACAGVRAREAVGKRGVQEGVT